MRFSCRHAAFSLFYAIFHAADEITRLDMTLRR